MEPDAHVARIRVLLPDRRDESLSEATASLMDAAAVKKCGILVTRHSHDLYSAVVSVEVPYGETREVSRI